jgi:DNA-binding NarL/FixJ family response regulator
MSRDEKMATPFTVLFVDGHAGVRAALTDRLRQAPEVGAVTATRTLEAAVQLAQDVAPDVVLYDPRTVAGDAVQGVRVLGHGGRPVVVLTSSLLEDERAILMRAGAAAVLLKGTAVPTLLAAMAAALTRDPEQPADVSGLSSAQRDAG